jgi:hypothetical protein
MDEVQRGTRPGRHVGRGTSVVIRSRNNRASGQFAANANLTHLGRIAVIREPRGQRVDQAKALVGTGQKKHTTIGTYRAAIERGGDFLTANVW